MPNAVTGLEILFELLVQENIGTDPADNKPWPVFVGNQPDTLPQSIALFDIVMPVEGRIQKTGETIAHEGVQVRVNAKRYDEAREKIKEIQVLFDAVLKVIVSVGNDQYEVHCVHQVRTPAYIGQDESDRDSFTLDCSTICKKVA